MANDMSSEQMQVKITAARREAEGLKDRIKRKKDDLADTSRTCHSLEKCLRWARAASILLSSIQQQLSMQRS